jgi:hypothetical protein
MFPDVFMPSLMEYHLYSRRGAVRRLFQRPTTDQMYDTLCLDNLANGIDGCVKFDKNKQTVLGLDVLKAQSSRDQFPNGPCMDVN